MTLSITLRKRSTRPVPFRATAALQMLALALLLAAAWIAPALAMTPNPEDATELVRRTSQRMLETLEARRAEVDRNPALIFGLVERDVAPHFDFERIAQGAVGQYWGQASPEQQRALTHGFKQLLIRTYARSLLSYSGEAIRYLPTRPGNRPTQVTVATEVREQGNAPIPVDYRMHYSDGAWRVYDVVINNASLVGNYRTSFANEIRQNGMDALIAKLDGMNLKGQE